MRETWRLIDSGPGHPCYNMALDEALMRLAGEGVVVRFYSWEPPGLSLGYFQDAARFDAKKLESEGIVLVRRPTGGGAIFHYEELTFAVAAAIDASAQLGSTIEKRYENIHGAVIKALAALGVGSRMRGGGLDPPFSPSEHKLCFNRTIGCDIVAAGRKLVGSAQRKTPDGLLQHGSIPLRRNPMTPGAAWVSELAGRNVEYAELAAALAEEFETLAGRSLERSGPSREESALAEKLVKERYSDDSWNLKR